MSFTELVFRFVALGVAVAVLVRVLFPTPVEKEATEESAK